LALAEVSAEHAVVVENFLAFHVNLSLAWFVLWPDVQGKGRHAYRADRS